MTTTTHPNLSLPDLQEVGAGAFFRPRDAEELGVSYYELQQLVDDGSVERIGRGLYRLADVEITENYSLAAVCARVPHAVVCLLSALQVYRIGTRLPREVWIAIPHKAREPQVPEFKVRFVRFSGVAARYGVQETEFEGVPTRITSIPRTVVDCFRFHRIVSRETALEALRESILDRLTTPDAIWRSAEACGAKSLVGPPMEVLVS